LAFYQFILVERKGNWLIFQYFLYEKRFKEETPQVYPLFDCRTQQIRRIFLTWISNICSSKQIVCCDRDFACKRNDQAICLIILGNFEDLNQVMVNGIGFDYFFFSKNPYPKPHQVSKVKNLWCYRIM